MIADESTDISCQTQLVVVLQNYKKTKLVHLYYLVSFTFWKIVFEFYLYYYCKLGTLCVDFNKFGCFTDFLKLSLKVKFSEVKTMQMSLENKATHSILLTLKAGSWFKHIFDLRVKWVK